VGGEKEEGSKSRLGKKLFMSSGDKRCVGGGGVWWVGGGVGGGGGGGGGWGGGGWVCGGGGGGGVGQGGDMKRTRLSLWQLPARASF